MASAAGRMQDSGILKAARENKDLLTMAGKGIQAAMPNAASDAAMMNAETQRMLADQQIAQQQLEEERKRKIAELLMPYASEMTGFFGMNRNR